MPQENEHWPHGLDDVVADVKRSLWPVAVVLAVLIVVNLLTNRLAPSLYLVWAWTGAAVLLVIALRDGESWRDIGLGPLTKRAVLASLTVVGIVFVIYLIAAIAPNTRDAFGDIALVHCRPVSWFGARLPVSPSAPCYLRRSLFVVSSSPCCGVGSVFGTQWLLRRSSSGCGMYCPRCKSPNQTTRLAQPSEPDQVVKS